MEEDTLNILSEIEKKCQEQEDETFEKVASINEDKSHTDGLGAMADDTNELSESANATVTDTCYSEPSEHSYCVSKGGDTQLNGHSDVVAISNTDETVVGETDLNKQNIDTVTDSHSDEVGVGNHPEETAIDSHPEETAAESHPETAADNHTEETSMEVDDTEETEKQTQVNGEVNDDPEDGNSDIVEFDVNVNADTQNDSDDRSVDLSQEIDGTIEIQENSDTDTDEEETENRADESVNSVEGDRSYSQEEYSSDRGNDTSGLYDESGSGTPGISPLLRKDGRPRKRRKKWGKGWSALRVNKSRKLDKIVIRKYERMASSDKGTAANMYVAMEGSETGEGTSSAEAGTETNTEAGEGASGDAGTPGSGRKKTSRDAALRANCSIDFIMGDDAIDRIIAQDGRTPKVKKRRSLLIDSGEKAPVNKGPPLSPEMFEMYSVPFKHGWRRELVLRGTTGENAVSSRKPQPSDVYYFPPFGTKIRSMVQVQEWLVRENAELTSANFTFMRRPIGVSEGEVVRHASASRGRGVVEVAKKKRKIRQIEETQYHDDDNPLYDTPEVVIERDSDEFLTPIINAGISGDLPPVRFDTSCSSSPTKSGRSRKKQMFVNDTNHETVEMMHPSQETVIVTPTKMQKLKIKATARKSTGPRQFKMAKQPIPYTGTESLCTLKCPGLEGMAPMLMCKKCMCLFHNECVNHFDDDIDFICLRCKDDQAKAEAAAAAAPPKPIVLRVAGPVKFNNQDQSLISVASTTARPVSVAAINGPTTWSLPVASLIGPSFSVAGQQRQGASPVVLHMNSSSSTPLVAPGTPTMTSLLASKSKFPVICPLLSVKQEPKDSSYDSAKQASSQALGSLKNVLSARGSPGASDQFLGDLNAGHVSPIMSTPVSLIKNSNNKRQSPGIRPGPVIPNTAYQMSQNSNFRLVPVGPPVSLPNVPFQPIKLPGMPVQGLMPISSISVPMQTMPSPVNAKLTTFGDLPKTPLQSTKSTGTTQSLSSLSNMVSMVEAGATSTASGQAVSKDSNKASRLVIDGTTIGAPETGQLLTLPGAVSRKLTLNKPLVLKIKNRQISVPPSGFFQARDGLKIFVPPNTFPTDEPESSPSKTSSADKVTVTENRTSPAKTPSSKPSGVEGVGEGVSVVSSVKGAREVCRSRRYNKCCLIQRLYGGYDCMFHIFRFLNIKDLMAVSLVCRTWKMISQNPSLWNDASFRGLRVSSWPKAMEFLKTRGVSSISLLGMTPYDDLERTWNGFITSVGEVPTLRKVMFGLVPPLVLDSACLKLTHLESLCAQCVSSEDGESMWTKPTRLDIGKFGSVGGLQELRLKGVCGLTLPTFSLCGGIGNLATLTSLHTLSLTSLKNVEGSKFHFISELKNLSELALGECKGWTAETYAVLGEQTRLGKLRLEHGGEIPDIGMGEAISKLYNLHTLELYTFTIADTFKDHVKQLPDLRTLVIWPDNSNQPAQVNSNTYRAVCGLQSLARLKWVIQNKANDSIILDDDNNDGSDTATPAPEQEFIPFLSEKGDGDLSSSLPEEPQNTEFIGVRQLTEDLSSLLPDTRINVYCLKADQETQQEV